MHADRCTKVRDSFETKKKIARANNVVSIFRGSMNHPRVLNISFQAVLSINELPINVTCVATCAEVRIIAPIKQFYLVTIFRVTNGPGRKIFPCGNTFRYVKK